MAYHIHASKIRYSFQLSFATSEIFPIVAFFFLVKFSWLKQRFHSYVTQYKCDFMYLYTNKIAWNFSAHIKILEVNWKSWFCHTSAHNRQRFIFGMLWTRQSPKKLNIEKTNQQKFAVVIVVIVNLKPQLQLFNHFLFEYLELSGTNILRSICYGFFITSSQIILMAFVSISSLKFQFYLLAITV